MEQILYIVLIIATYISSVHQLALHIDVFKDPVPFVVAAPLHSNILEWHYVIRGAPQTPYEGYFSYLCLWIF